jgi:hypothetical protein
VGDAAQLTNVFFGWFLVSAPLYRNKLCEKQQTPMPKTIVSAEVLRRWLNRAHV